MTQLTKRTSSPSHRFGLSKSKISAFEQCAKRLWLSVHRPKEAKFDEGSDLRFAVGNEVGEAACSLYPSGFMVEAEPDLSAALETTKKLLDAGHTEAIFEATFEHEGVLVRVDILEPAPIGGWQIAEVKSSTKAKDYHLGDLATQVWVLREAGLEISHAAIRHLNNQFELTCKGEWVGLFQDAELLEAIEPLVQGRSTVTAAARKVLSEPEPDIAVGPHCHTPFDCEFSAYCSSNLAQGPDWPVTVLPGGGGKRWLEQGVEDLLEIEPDQLKSQIHKRVYQATVEDRPYHDVEGARRAVSEWAYPRSWLDFETIAFALPRWIGTRPYQQVPFQFSLHVEQLGEKIEHSEFLDLTGEDPRRQCALALLETVPQAGAVITYNAGFERSCIRTLTNACPDLASDLENIERRIVDLLPVTKANWYHRDQRGSWSIKAVLPTISGGSAYSDMRVQSGVQAQTAYLEAIYPETPTACRHAIAKDLLAYCKKDTEAMIALVKHLTAWS